MVSDSELAVRLREFLSTSDLNQTTTAIVRRRLEEDFGVNLSDKKAFIREQVDLYLQSQFEKAEENEKGEDNEEEECDDGEVKSEEEEEEDDEVEDESRGRTRNGKGSAKKGTKKPKEEGKKRGGGGFCKVCSLSPTLQEFVGVPELARTEVVKKLWIYIREKDLQDPKNRRDIICDDTLRALFGVNRINMFQMNKVLAKHIWPLDSDEVAVKPNQKEKQLKHEREEENDEPKKKEKRQKGGSSGATSGFLTPIQLSDALIKFLDTGESALPRSEVVKRIWAYIKQNDLQDPSDKRRILSDEKLKELFDVDSFNGFSLTKHLTAHFIKPEK